LANGFGHFGYGGSGAWCDPEQRLAVAMVTNQVAGGPFGDMRIAKLGAAAVRCAALVRGKPHRAERDASEREAGLAGPGAGTARATRTPLGSASLRAPLA
jgi:CubicO group peptidase (beta-lactamase class C family)